MTDAKLPELGPILRHQIDLGGGNVAGVNLHLAVGNDGLDDAPLLEVSDALAGQRAVDLKTVDESGDGHKAVGLDILVELVRGVLVEDDSVLGLVLDLALRPLLLLLLASSSGCHFVDVMLVVDGDAEETVGLLVPVSCGSLASCLPHPAYLPGGLAGSLSPLEGAWKLRCG
jgi:hypothetical protein